MFCSGGADGNAFIFNGKTGEKVGSLGGDKAHSGGIYAVSNECTRSTVGIFKTSQGLPFYMVYCCMFV